MPTILKIVLLVSCNPFTIYTFISLALIVGSYIRSTTVEKVKTVVSTTIPDGICMEDDVDKDGGEIRRRVACDADLPHLLIIEKGATSIAMVRIESLKACEFIAENWLMQNSGTSYCWPIRY